VKRAPSPGGGGAGRALEVIASDVVSCARCPRLVAWREEVGRRKRRAYRDETYWARPVPGFGDPAARLVLLGLAPGAHGANRTGRMFTGDGSGDFLYPALHRAGLASKPDARARDDGLELRGCFITAACRCAPPGNKPTTAEIAACAPFLARELAALGRARAVLALGAIAFESYLDFAARGGAAMPRPRPRFAHGAVFRDGLPHALVASYHVSRQNTQTGRLTEAMFDEVLATALRLADL
jgi:uracil-DNA glycosylase family 4